MSLKIGAVCVPPTEREPPSFRSRFVLTFGNISLIGPLSLNGRLGSADWTFSVRISELPNVHAKPLTFRSCFQLKQPRVLHLGPVNRLEVEKLKMVIVWDDAGQWRSVYMAAILKIERSQP